MDASFNDEKFQSQLEQLEAVLILHGRFSDAGSLVKDEMRLFLKQAIKFTPPKTKAQGENAINRDLRNIFTPVEDGAAQQIAREFGTDNVRHWLTSPTDGKPYEVQWSKLDVQGSGMEPYHESQRDSRGRTRPQRGHRKEGNTWIARYVVSDSAMEAYRNKIKARVGQLKSGLATAYVALGGKVGGWVTRHLSKNLGSIVDNLDAPSHPNVTAITRAAGAASYARIYSEALRARKESMAKRIALIIGDYGRAIKHGEKPKHAFHPEDSGSVE